MEKIDLKSMDATALNAEVIQLKKELFNIRMGMMTAQVKDTSHVGKVKVRIAQALTYLNQKKKTSKK